MVEAWHGTNRDAAKAVVSGDPWVLSTSKWDWLGDGIYFWQSSPERAWNWARDRFGNDAAVVRALVDLDGCLDLLQPSWFSVFDGVHEQVLSQLTKAGLTPPAQRGLAHGMDRLVVNYAVGALEARGMQVRSVRAAFAEGEPVYPGSALFSQNHVQIAVRDATVLHDVVEEAP